MEWRPYMVWRVPVVEVEAEASAPPPAAASCSPLGTGQTNFELYKHGDTVTCAMLRELIE